VWVGFKIFHQGFSDALVDDNFMAIASFLLFDPKSFFDLAIFFHDLIDLKLQQVRDAQSRIDSHHKKQQVSITILAS
jgi:hypothetical protein